MLPGTDMVGVINSRSRAWFGRGQKADSTQDAPGLMLSNAVEISSAVRYAVYVHSQSNINTLVGMNGSEGVNRSTRILRALSQLFRKIAESGDVVLQHFVRDRL